MNHILIVLPLCSSKTLYPPTRLHSISCTMHSVHTTRTLHGLDYC